MKAKFKKHKIENGISGSKRFELDIYLTKAIVEEEGNFDALRWWKLNLERFPTFSRLARDVLAILMSTVASELAFSTGRRVIDVTPLTTSSQESYIT